VSQAFDAFRVHTAVDALPAKERDVIALAYFEGLSQSEVADRLELPLGTVKTRTRAALARLAERLGHEQVVHG
jgi:RNA polymerase sigma-70 factor, ECF subfamily